MKLLVVDDDNIFRKNLSRALLRRGYEVYVARGGMEAINLASEKSIDIALIDMKMPEMNGLEVIREIKGIQPDIVGVILTGYGSIPNAVEAMKLGAYDYLTKPCKVSEIEAVIKKVDRPKCKEFERPIIKDYHGIVGSSKAIKHVIEAIRAVKDSNLPVLITGESGTGKELVARALHFDSVRKEGPFIAINCASLKPELLENELFGHVKGAFTGATTTKYGLLKAADGGTLFIDEIADMNPAVQASLLRFLETGLFRPLGSINKIRVNVRIIAAINKDIEEEVKAKRFRHDLYYRLNVCRIDIPPLRERREDIPFLVEHFLETSPVAKEKSAYISHDAVEALKSCPWPGNVRELFNILCRTILVSNRKSITRSDILFVTKETSGSSYKKSFIPLSLHSIEERHIREALKANNGNISRTAKTLGIDRRTLQRKLKKYGISL